MFHLGDQVDEIRHFATALITLATATSGHDKALGASIAQMAFEINDRLDAIDAARCEAQEAA